MLTDNATTDWIDAGATHVINLVEITDATVTASPKRQDGGDSMSPELSNSIPTISTFIPPFTGPTLGVTPMISAIPVNEYLKPVPLRPPLSLHTSTVTSPRLCRGDLHTIVDAITDVGVTLRPSNTQRKSTCRLGSLMVNATSVPPLTGPIRGCIPKIAPVSSYENSLSDPSILIPPTERLNVTLAGSRR